MNLRPRRREEPEIILIPFIDILLMLLIFFMLATTFRHAAEISINLPEASQSKPDQEPKTIDVAIDERGHFYIDRQEVVNTEIGTVKRAMEKAVADRKDLVVVISADSKTPHQAVVTAMDAARQLGLVRISIAAQKPKASP